MFPKITLILILKPREKILFVVVGQTKKRGKTRCWCLVSSEHISTLCITRSMEVMGIWHFSTVRWPDRGEERGQVRELERMGSDLG